MGKIVISENVSLDGVVEDPTGEEGFRHGGWFTEFGAKDYQAWAEVGLAEALGADGAADGAAQRRVLRYALAVPERRVGGPAEQPAEVRRVLDARGAGVGQRDGR